MSEERKYDKFYHSEDILHDPDEYTAHKYFGVWRGNIDVDCVFAYNTITEVPPDIYAEDVHELNEFIAFAGANPEDMSDFDAEIEVTLNGEKKIVDKATVVAIPAGVKHSLLFKAVNKPMVMVAAQFPKG